MNPKVSIIVPIYKVPEQYMRKCIESLQQQSLNDIEIILVDDGSPDECGAICDSYKNQDARIVVIHKENGGLAAARNTGVEVAKGEWITFVDGDDWLDCMACEKAVAAGTEKQVDIVCWGYAKDYKNKSQNYEYRKYFQNGKVYEGTECAYFQEMALNFDSHISTAYAKLIRRDFLLKNNISHDGKLRQGWEGIEFCVRLFGAAKKILFLEEWWYHYTYNPQSISNVRGEKNNAYVLGCIEKISSEIKAYPNKDELEKWLNNRIMYLVVATAISGYFNPANQESYAIRKKQFDKFLDTPTIKKAFCNYENRTLSTQRKIVIFCAKTRLYFILELLGKLRMAQKKTYGAK